MAKCGDGQIIKVGEQLGFKDDVEQYGTVIRVTGEQIRLSVYDSQTGQSTERSVEARRTWHE